MHVPTPKDAFPKKDVSAEAPSKPKPPYQLKPHLTHRPFRQGLAQLRSQKTQKET